MWPNGLTIDYESGRVIWCDSFMKTIESMKLPIPKNNDNNLQQGSGWFETSKNDRKIHLMSKQFMLSYDDYDNKDIIRQPYGLALYKDVIFWSEFESGHIMRLHLSTNMTTLVRKENPKIFSLKV